MKARIYDPRYMEAWDEPCELEFTKWEEILEELTQIGLFLGRSGRMIVLAVIDGGKND